MITNPPRRPVLGVLGLLVGLSLACSTLTPTLPPAPPGSTPAAVTEAVIALPAGPSATPPPPLPTLTPPPASTLVASSEELELIDLYDQVNPSVVSILVAVQGVGVEGVAQGSGFVFDTEGHIVTNQHVVADAVNIEVDFASGLKMAGTVVGTDPDADLAVIRVEGPTEGLVPLPLADSDSVRVGQRVVAIGNPFGLAGTMTVGIISGLGRSLESNRAAPTEGGGFFSAPDIIQTDAAINPGNSGGPLLNMAGEVIGVNKAIESQTGVNSGVGFAIASNTVKQIVPYLIEDGKFVYPYLGLSSQSELTLAAQQALRLPQATGAYIVSVVPDGPADQAGVRADSATDALQLRGDGDLIVAIDGNPVVVFADLLSYLVNHTRPGQTVTLSIVRRGQPVDVDVVLGERP